MASYLVTGSNRGFGLALVQELLSHPADKVSRVFATSRAATGGSDLDELAKSDARLQYLSLDVTDHESIGRAVSATLADAHGLDVLINSAGVQDRVADGKPEHLTGDEFQRVMTTNVMAVHAITQAFLPVLRRGKEKKVINISSTVGSMLYNQRGLYDRAPSPAYKITKAALNALTLQWHFGLKDEGFIVKSISPGWMKTELGTQYAQLEPRDGAQAVIAVIMNEGSESAGRFRNIRIPGVSEMGRLPYDGTDPPF